MVSIRSAFSKMKERHKVIYWQQWQIKKEICILKRHKDFALHPLWKSHQALSAYRACDSIRLMYLLLRLVPHNSEVCIICSVFIPAGSSKHQHHSHITPVVINAAFLQDDVSSQIWDSASRLCSLLFQLIQTSDSKSSVWFLPRHSLILFSRFPLWFAPCIFWRPPFSKAGWPVWLSSLFEYLVSCIFKVQLQMNRSGLSKLEYLHKSHPKFSNHRDKK